jgi:hypothetical protein
MRARVIVLVIAILLMAGFAALNWSEFLRPSTLSFGAFMTEAPLGLIMLVLTGLVLVAWLLSAAAMRTHTLIESRHHFKTLEAQRELADKAEASRFTDLRTHFDAQMKELRQREAIAATEFEKSMLTAQRDLRTNLEQMNRMMMGRIAELEQRLDGRLERIAGLPHRDMLHEEPRIRDERLRSDGGPLEPPPRVRHPL